MTWSDLTFTSSHILTASDMNRLQGNFAALAEGDSGAPPLAVNSFMVTGVASIATLNVSSEALLGGGTVQFKSEKGQVNGYAGLDGTAKVPGGQGGVPTGAVVPYAGTSAPAGWLLCNGGAVSRTTYADLFAAIGTVFGAGDGSTTFNVPDLRGRAVVALDNLGGSSANRITGTWADSLGGTGGAETHTLTEAQMPSHVHTTHDEVNRTGAAGSFTTVRFGINESDQGTLWTGAAGGDGAHNNVQPAMALGYVIKT